MTPGSDRIKPAARTTIGVRIVRSQPQFEGTPMGTETKAEASVAVAAGY